MGPLFMGTIKGRNWNRRLGNYLFTALQMLTRRPSLPARLTRNQKAWPGLTGAVEQEQAAKRGGSA